MNLTIGIADVQCANLTKGDSSALNTSGLSDQKLELEDFIDQMRDQVKYELVAYIVLFVIGCLGNLYVLFKLYKYGHSNRMNYLLKHLTIADTLVVLVTISIEIGWRITIRWPFGEFWCKFGMFARTFGLYLTSCVLIAISIDRYYAFIKPLDIHSKARNRWMLIGSYLMSVVLCVPQVFVFHLDYHPAFGTKFAQCQTHGSFSSTFLEQLYTIGTAVGIYFVPLAFIIYCYGAIIRSFHRTDRQLVLQEPSGTAATTTASTTVTPRDTIMQRATNRTLRAASAIVFAFVLCWTPYVVTLVWEQLDSQSLEETLPKPLKDIFYVFSVTNSCLDPFVHSAHLFRRLFTGHGRPRSPRSQTDFGHSTVVQATSTSMINPSKAMAKNRHRNANDQNNSIVTQV